MTNKYLVAGMMLGCMAMYMPLGAAAAPTMTPSMTPTHAMASDICLNIKDTFPKQIVSEVLTANGFTQAQIDAVNKDLSEKNAPGMSMDKVRDSFSSAIKAQKPDTTSTLITKIFDEFHLKHQEMMKKCNGAPEQK